MEGWRLFADVELYDTVYSVQRPYTFHNEPFLVIAVGFIAQKFL